MILSRHGRLRVAREARERIDQMAIAVTLGYAQAQISAGVWRGSVRPGGATAPSRALSGEALWEWAGAQEAGGRAN